MRLRNFLNYNEIIVQCHDNPDADALASGFGVYTYLKKNGKNVSFVYGGQYEIQKSNLVLMVEELGIPVKHVTDMAEPELLIMVDCQYREGNVTYFPAKQVAVLDHHQICSELPELSDVRSNLGSCSTLIWSLLKQEGYDVNKNRMLATALYYGLYTDTGNFTEISHPLDKDLRDEAVFERTLISKFRNSNLSLRELEIAGRALIGYDYNEEYRFAVVEAKPCDPNILGLISDLILEVDAVDNSLVYSVLPFGVKISVRSCIKEVKASELAEAICAGIGSGGGHLEKAGGFLQLDLLKKEYNISTLEEINTFLTKRMVAYFAECEVIYAKKYCVDSSKMKVYRKELLPLGYVKGTTLFPAGTDITVRTMEGDIDTQIEEDTIIMIGTSGEIYLNKEAKFLKSYSLSEDPYELQAEYNPIVKDATNSRVVSILPYAKVCISTGVSTIRAKQLDHTVKVFTEWDESKYMRGKKGDYLVVHGADEHDIYTMDKETFEKNYCLVEEAAAKNHDIYSDIEAVVFDLDGTLLDTLQDLTNAVNAALEKMDMPLRSVEEVRQFVGNGVKKLMERAIPDGSKNPLFEETYAYFCEYYAVHCKENTKPYDGVLALMKELRDQGKRIAIVSNKMDSAVKILDQDYFAGLTDAAIGESELVPKKPAPDMVKKALEEIGVTKEHAIYVGDSEVDIQTAVNSGLPCVSITWGFRNPKFLLEHGAKHLIDEPEELLEII